MAGGVFHGYYTIWLALVKGIFVPFWELGQGKRASDSGVHELFALQF